MQNPWATYLYAWLDSPGTRTSFHIHNILEFSVNELPFYVDLMKLVARNFSRSLYKYKVSPLKQQLTN